MPAQTVRDLSRQWIDRLSGFRSHKNDEHREALVEEASRYAGMHLENDLARSGYWSKAPLSRRVAVLLFLVDRGAVCRGVENGRRVYLAQPHAEEWVLQQQALAPYLGPVLELIAALRTAKADRGTINPS
ncbi:hypothetical protein EP7_003605 [Isosphaeraceae bacterium EP7]